MKVVQGAYISQETKQVIEKEAKRRGIFPARLAAEILEKEVKRLLRKEEINEDKSTV
jgi:hypothetical protein